jgi:2-oxoacid:acceptor oxidoreductase gamma subunit (pyruvate/2-ketoisovalerate family)
MVEIRFHGRGGQGAVLASEILGQAMFLEGWEVQTFPSFGAERRGAPVMAFVRSDRKVIRKRTQIHEPDHVVVMSTALMKMGLPFTDGLRKGGTLLFNTVHEEGLAERYADFRVYAIDGNPIAARHGLGTAISPIVNCVVLGALVGATSLVSLGSLSKAISLRLSVRPEANTEAAEEAARAVHLVNGE